MTPTPENREVELVHGMRGGIPSERMEQIHLGLPYSMELRDVLPYLADPLAAPLVRIDRMRARVRLSDGWHTLNQARMALVESEACKVFYEDVQPDPVEADYHCRFYLDDAALRLYSSCEHLLWCVVAYWNLPSNVSQRKVRRSLWVLVKRIVVHLTRDLLNVARGKTVDRLPPLLARVIREAERSEHPQVSGEVAKILRRLRSNEAWKGCTKYRHDWVHNRLPAIKGLSSDIVFKTFDYGQELPPEILKHVGPKKGVKMTVGVGRDISILRETVRNAYGELFQAYKRLAKLLAKDNEALRIAPE